MDVARNESMVAQFKAFGITNYERLEAIELTALPLAECRCLIRSPIRNYLAPCARYAETIASVKPNEEPTASLLRTLTVCPWASTICFTMARPRPVPPMARARLRSAR